MKSEIFIAAASSLLLMAGSAAPPARMVPLHPPVNVVDGDTVRLPGGAYLRLRGIDAPERGQTCISATGGTYEWGRTATEYARYILRSGGWCEDSGKRGAFGRALVKCFEAIKGRDVAAELIRRGLAITPTRYERTLYAAEQAEAKAAKRGYWSGAVCQSPKLFRRANQ